MNRFAVVFVIIVGLVTITVILKKQEPQDPVDYSKDIAAINKRLVELPHQMQLAINKGDSGLTMRIDGIVKELESVWGHIRYLRAQHNAVDPDNPMATKRTPGLHLIRPAWSEVYPDAYIPKEESPYKTGDPYSDKQLWQQYNRATLKPGRDVARAFTDGITRLEIALNRRLTEKEKAHLFEATSEMRHDLYFKMLEAIDQRLQVVAERFMANDYTIAEGEGNKVRLAQLPPNHTVFYYSREDRTFAKFVFDLAEYPTALPPEDLYQKLAPPFVEEMMAFAEGLGQ